MTPKLLVLAAALAASSVATAQTAGPGAPAGTGLGAVATPNSGQLDGPGSPTGSGLGGTDSALLPNVGGNGFNNNTSLNGSSASGSAAGAPGTAPAP